MVTEMKSELTEKEIEEIIEFSRKVTETAKKYYLLLACFIECDKCVYKKTCDIKFTKEPCWKVVLTRDYCIWRDLKSGRLSVNDKVPKWVKKSEIGRAHV